MHRNILTKKRLCGALVSLMLIRAASILPADELRFYEPDKVYREEDSKQFAYDGKSGHEEDARIVAGYIYRTYGEDDYPFIYAIPGLQGYFLVSAGGRQVDTDYGWRFILLRSEGDDLVELFYGRGAFDSYILDPYFYIGEKKILILAETGTEYTWGFEAYEFDIEGKTISYLDRLPVARVDESEDSWGELINPLDRAQVSMENGRYTIAFTTDIVLDPGGMEERLIESHGGQIVFHYDGKSFVMEPPVYQ
jgi:hypothetical protein